MIQVGKRAIDAILQGLMKSGVASGIDKAVFNGSGTDGEPLGILNTSGIDSADGGTFSKAKATARLKVIENANLEATAWVCGPDVAEILRNRETATGTGRYLLGDDGLMCGKPVYVTSHFPAATLLCGNFAEGAALASWGPSVEVLIDKDTYSKSGQVQIIAFASVDVFVKRTGAFAISVGVS